MNYERIKNIISKKGFTFREVSRQCDVTEMGLHQMIRNGSMKVEYLEKIAKVLDEPIWRFFDDGEPSADEQKRLLVGKKDVNVELLAENERLKTEVNKLKDKIIELLEKK